MKEFSKLLFNLNEISRSKDFGYFEADPSPFSSKHLTWSNKNAPDCWKKIPDCGKYPLTPKSIVESSKRSLNPEKIKEEFASLKKETRSH
jgi:hypothetical protein